MLKPADIGLIESDGDPPPRECRLSVVVEGNHVLVPIPQPSPIAVFLLTLGLFALATPLCIFILAYAPMPPGIDIALTRVMVGIAWIIAVFGPAAFYLIWPSGILRPDHWLRFDRVLGLLSIRGGWSILRHDEILCFLAVTDLRKRQTEFQVVARSNATHERHFVASCRVLDPERAFGEAIERFCGLCKINACYATIAQDGKIDLSCADDKPSDPLNSQVDREFES